MVRITRVHTGNGDGGETSLLTGERVPKSNARVELYGTIDELNSLIGWVRMELSRLPKQHSDGGVRVPALRIEEELDPMLSFIQQELFDIGGESAGISSALPEQMALVEMKHADRLTRDESLDRSTISPQFIHFTIRFTRCCGSPCSAHSRPPLREMRSQSDGNRGRKCRSPRGSCLSQSTF